MGLTDWSGCVCESRLARKRTLASLTSPASSRRSFMIPVKCFQLCTFHYRQRPQCDKLPFMKFTTFCPLNPILDATKINPLKCRTCNAISITHYHEHCGQFVTAVGRLKSLLTTRRSLWLKDKHQHIGTSLDSSFLFSPLYCMILELDVVTLGSNTNSNYWPTDTALS
jgi:hypothetical protein